MNILVHHILHSYLEYSEYWFSQSVFDGDYFKKSKIYISIVLFAWADATRVIRDVGEKICIAIFIHKYSMLFKRVYATYPHGCSIPIGVTYT